jgi:predicted small lipoprotein YifL
MSRRRQLWLLALLAAATTGCGLKGPLTLPSRSDEIVIRGPGQATSDPAATPATSPATTPPATPVTPVTPVTPPDERPPPPPLPRSNSGTARGG